MPQSEETLEPATGTSAVELPGFVPEAIEIYVNGIAQKEGEDYELVGRRLVFPRILTPEVKMTKVKWFLVTFGVGAYKKHDSVDVIYEKDGRRLVASGLPILHPDSWSD